MPEKHVSPQVAARDAEVDGEVTTMADLTQPPEVVVDEVTVTRPPTDDTRMVVIRVNESIENMSHVAAGRRESYTFEAGHRYRVPVYIAQELEAAGRIWH